MPDFLRIGICSTYAPRACGLATFAADLENALTKTGNIASVAIIAMVGSGDASGGSPQPPVIVEIVDSDPASYAVGARRANDECDVVIVQHEFGIFGGEDGELILDFLRELRIPAVLTLHTVLSDFSAKQAETLRSACELSAGVTVFTKTARSLLVRQGIVPADRVSVIPHGAPDALFNVNRAAARIPLGLKDQFVLSTFGLVSPGKGLELVLDAMSHLVISVPSAMFVIAGRTHPAETRHSGEHYRSSLIAQVRRLGLDRNVRFIDSFLPIEGIADVLAATDVFVTPYINAQQSVSGALTFAVAAGCPTVSTDYLYAHDLLDSGAGTVVRSRDPEEFANAIRAYAISEPARVAARTEAIRIGSSMHWEAVGMQMADLATCLANVTPRHMMFARQTRKRRATFRRGHVGARRPLVATTSAFHSILSPLQRRASGE